jgi:SAM-dependent methyltransferase
MRSRVPVRSSTTTATPSPRANSTTRYVLDNAKPEATGRFDALAAIFDAGTRRHVETLGPVDNWRCLEVAAGGGSIARWLADRVGPDGRVVATDIDIGHLRALSLPNLEVLQQNILEDGLREASFDLVHARLLLVHLPQREEALDRMISALRPGGWLLAEEFDGVSTRADSLLNPAETLLKSSMAWWAVMEAAGVEIGYGRRLAARLKAHGLVEVDAEASIPLWQGGSPFSQLIKANWNQLHDQMVASGLVTEAELADDLQRLEDPAFMSFGETMWSAWGRKPRS